MATGALTQPNADALTIDALVQHVREGRVRVPTFQRPLRWKRDDVRRLFDSILKGYPIGSLLLWKRPAEEQQLTLGRLTIDAPKLDSALWVIDGQQRLTSLANVLLEGGATDEFAVSYDLELQTLAEIGPERPHRVPLYLLFDLQALLRWFAQSPSESGYLTEATRVAALLKQYKVPVYVVEQQDESVLRDIFDRMNTFGRRLSRAEVFDALRATSPNERLADVAERVHERTHFGLLEENTLLLCSLARRGRNLQRDFRAEVPRSEDGKLDAVANARENAATEEALALAVGFLQSTCHVPHVTFLPYAYLAVVLCRFFALHPAPRQRNLDLLRRFFWRAALAGPRIARGAYTGTLGMLVGCIEADDESASVQKLLAMAARADLDLAPAIPVLPKRFSAKVAEARFVLSAMWRNGPRSFSTHEPYELAELAEVLEGRTTATDALTLLFPDADGAKLRTENRLLDLERSDRLVLPRLDEARLRDPALDAVLASHALPLRWGSEEEVLVYRRDALASLTRDFLRTMTELALEDTPPLDDLEEDDDEVEADAWADDGERPRA